MGSSESKTTQPQKLVAFKKISQFSEVQIPETAENRVPTDRKYLVVFFLLVLLLIPFLVYTLLNADIGRFWGYDECGNVCGQKNAKYDQWECTGKDFRNEKLLQYADTVTRREFQNGISIYKSRKCVSECDSDHIQVLNTCIKSSKTTVYVDKDEHDESNTLKITDYLEEVSWIIATSCLSSLIFTMAILYLFRIATAAMVWSILAGVWTYLLIVAGFFWFAYILPDRHEGVMATRSFPLFVAVFFTIILLILLIIMIFLYKRVKLVIALLQEAMKAVFAMPQLMFIPLLSFFVQLVILGVFLTTQIIMASAGTLTQLNEKLLEYDMNFVMSFTLLFNFWMTFCASQIVVGIQYMVIAGAVAKWYFAQNKDYLDGPTMTSASIAFRFHLGTVVFGSMVITLTAIIRAIINSLFKNKCIRCLVDCCLQMVEDFIRFLTKNAYIMTAMHGKPFYKSGKRAAEIILQNALNIATINCVGDFILFMACLLVMLSSLLFTYLIMPASNTGYEWSVYVIVAVVSIFVASIGFSIFETVIDTIFLCFCEDSLLNDGFARPYYMSRELMEFMENSKKIFVKK